MELDAALDISEAAVPLTAAFVLVATLSVLLDVAVCAAVGGEAAPLFADAAAVEELLAAALLCVAVDDAGEDTTPELAEGLTNCDVLGAVEVVAAPAVAAVLGSVFAVGLLAGAVLGRAVGTVLLFDGEAVEVCAVLAGAGAEAGAVDVAAAAGLVAEVLDCATCVAAGLSETVSCGD